MVPEGWDNKPLGSLLTKVIDYRGKSVPKSDKGVLLITARNIRDGFLDFSSKEFISEGDYEAWMSRDIPKSGDILFTTEAPLGMVSMFPSSGKYAVGQRTVTLRTNSSLINAEFLHFFLRSQHGQQLVDLRSTGSTAKGIKSSELKKVHVLYPKDVNEQSKIASILSTWDKAIATVEKLLENSRTQKKALMQQLLTGKKRLPGFHKPWQEVRFNRVFERVTRKNHIGNGNVLTISGQEGLVSQVDYFNKSVASDDLSGYTLLEKGEFAYNKSYSKGYPMGAIKPLTRYDRGVVSSLYICFRLKDDRPSSKEFFRHYFEAGLFNREIYAIAQEGARNHGLLNVSVTDFFNTKLHIPEPAEKEAIEKIINTAEQELHNLEAQLDSLQSQKTALMQQLLTGKRRVKVESGA